MLTLLKIEELLVPESILPIQYKRKFTPTYVYSGKFDIENSFTNLTFFRNELSRQVLKMSTFFSLKPFRLKQL